MSVDAMIVPLLRVPLFRDLEPVQLKTLALNAEVHVFETGETIVEENQDGDCAYLVVDGNEAVYSGDEVEDQQFQLEPGTLIAEMAMLTETTHSSTIVANGKIRALALKRPVLHKMMSEDPTLADHFVDVIRKRLSVYEHSLGNLGAALNHSTEPAQAVNQ